MPLGGVADHDRPLTKLALKNATNIDADNAVVIDPVVAEVPAVGTWLVSMVPSTTDADAAPDRTMAETFKPSTPVSVVEGKPPAPTAYVPTYV